MFVIWMEFRSYSSCFLISSWHDFLTSSSWEFMNASTSRIVIAKDRFLQSPTRVSRTIKSACFCNLHCFSRGSHTMYAEFVISFIIHHGGWCSRWIPHESIHLPLKAEIAAKGHIISPWRVLDVNLWSWMVLAKHGGKYCFNIYLEEALILV